MENDKENPINMIGKMIVFLRELRGYNLEEITEALEFHLKDLKEIRDYITK